MIIVVIVHKVGVKWLQVKIASPNVKTRPTFVELTGAYQDLFNMGEIFLIERITYGCFKYRVTSVLISQDLIS